MANILLEQEPFNSAIEIGLRAVTLLVSLHPNSYSLNDLIILDYFLVYSKDLLNDFDSLHPQVPFRSGELIVKRDRLEKGLSLYMHKGLVELNMTNEGFKYSASESSRYFLDLLNNHYTINLIERAELLSNQIDGVSKTKLKNFFEKNLTKLGFDTFNETHLIKDQNHE